MSPLLNHTHPSYNQTYSVHPNSIDEEMEFGWTERDTHPSMACNNEKVHLFVLYERLCDFGFLKKNQSPLLNPNYCHKICNTQKIYVQISLFMYPLATFPQNPKNPKTPA